MSIRVTWLHEDGRGERSYRSIRQLARALQLDPANFHRYYTENGARKDSDLRPVGRPATHAKRVGALSKKSYFRKVLG